MRKVVEAVMIKSRSAGTATANTKTARVVNNRLAQAPPPASSKTSKRQTSKKDREGSTHPTMKSHGRPPDALPLPPRHPARGYRA
jgi:hypothetical protein